MFFGIFIPLMGTIFGSAMVFFFRNNLNYSIQKLLMGFSAGVMIAASIWSLLIPAIELSSKICFLSWFPAALGFVIGIIFLVFITYFVNRYSNLESYSCVNQLKKVMIMIIAIILHNIPEGMAVGVVFAGVLSHNELISMAGAIALSVGISIQNFPEGAIVSVPLRSNGLSKLKSFYYGVLSGVVEPIAAIITIMISNYIEKILPYLLSFAAGAMMYVVVVELIPDSKDNRNSYFGLFGITFGFVIMMILDVAFG